jgi:glycosyltransferase involved in cell wall biosynthesis
MMRILFPYLARWRSANRSRYHQLLTHLCRLGHRVYVLKAPPMALSDISSQDVDSSRFREPAGLEVSEIDAPRVLRSLLNSRLLSSKGFNKGALTLVSSRQISRFVDREKIDVLLVYNLAQMALLKSVECHRHFDLADDLVAMMKVEHSIISRTGGNRLARFAQHRLIAESQTITVASSTLKAGIDRDALLLPNGADLEELDRANPREWLNTHRGPTIGFVGAFEYWVDFDLVFGMAERMPRVTFLLVGGGRRWESVRDQIANRKLSNVHLTGALPYESAMSLASAMDVCLLPFTRDQISDAACPLKLFEYAALRKPIISTRTHEVELIGDGWVAFADDAEGAVALADSFLADRTRAQEAGQKGREIVEARYNWPRLARELADYLESRV